MDERTRSQEDYLETILLLKMKNGIVRAVDIADALSYSKPSVSRAVSILKAQGYVQVGEDYAVELTAPGEKIARKVYHRHCVLKRFLRFIGVSRQHAEQDACEMEHVLSEHAFAALEQFFLELEQSQIKNTGGE